MKYEEIIILYTTNSINVQELITAITFLKGYTCLTAVIFTIN